MIRSSRWPALIAAGAIAALCLAPRAKAERLGRDNVTVDAEQGPERCRTDCAIGKQSIVTLSGVEALVRDARPGTGPATTIGAWVVRDSRGRYAAISGDFRQLLIFDAAGKLLDSPRPTYGRIVSLFVDRMGAVQAFDSESGSLLTFDVTYQVRTKTELPHRPALPLGGDRFLVASHVPTPTLAGQPLHVMSKDGILRSFGADGSPFRSTETLKNWRAVCLNPDGTIWSIAAGGRLLERWDTATGRRIYQVTVKSTWFRESSTAAPTDQVANPIILTIWAEEEGFVWILYKAPDPNWIPRKLPEREFAANGENADLRSDWVLEAVRTDTGSVVAMRSFDRILLRREGSSAIASETVTANRARRVELWRPILVKKEKKPGGLIRH
jgi:hypothetical protein